MLKEHIGHEVSPTEADAYYAFCRQANSDLVRHALKELRGFAKTAKRLKAEGKEGPPFLPRLTRIYFRKVEEQARLFTALSIFETAYRVHLATWMEHYYGIRNWWQPVYAAVAAGGSCTHVTNINGIPLLPAVAHAIDKLLKGIDGYDLTGTKVAKQSTGQGLLNHSKLSDLEELIKEQWVQFKPSLADHNPALTTLDSFVGVFRRIREARNACFHHREAADRAGLFRNIENMLDLLHIHLETASINARMAAVRPVAMNVQWDERHNFGLLKSATYDIELHFENEKTKSTFNGRTTFEAIQRAIDGVGADDRLKLIGVSISDATAKFLSASAEGIADMIETVGTLGATVSHQPSTSFE